MNILHDVLLNVFKNAILQTKFSTKPSLLLKYPNFCPTESIRVRLLSRFIHRKAAPCVFYVKFLLKKKNYFEQDGKSFKEKKENHINLILYNLN